MLQPQIQQQPPCLWQPLREGFDLVQFHLTQKNGGLWQQGLGLVLPFSLVPPLLSSIHLSFLKTHLLNKIAIVSGNHLKIPRKYMYLSTLKHLKQEHSWIRNTPFKWHVNVIHIISQKHLHLVFLIMWPNKTIFVSKQFYISAEISVCRVRKSKQRSLLLRKRNKMALVDTFFIS